MSITYFCFLHWLIRNHVFEKGLKDKQKTHNHSVPNIFSELNLFICSSTTILLQKRIFGTKLNTMHRIVDFILENFQLFNAPKNSSILFECLESFIFMSKPTILPIFAVEKIEWSSPAVQATRECPTNLTVESKLYFPN